MRIVKKSSEKSECLVKCYNQDMLTTLKHECLHVQTGKCVKCYNMEVKLGLFGRGVSADS